MIWEAYQQGKIAGAERQALKAQAKADRYADDIATLKRHVDRLSLACQAMWELLRDHSDLTEQNLENKILEIDVRDGHLDNKIAAQITTCHHCGKPTNSTRTNCVMCGAPLTRQHQFEV